MRLSDSSKAIIKATASEVFGSNVVVRVFGSRLDDEARGGDLDLLVVSQAVVPEGARKTLRFIARLQSRLGDQPIDVLLLDPATRHQPIHEQALREGITL